MKKSTILVPIDFSEPSRRALRAAGQWARLFGGRITPLHVYEPITDLDGCHFYGPDTSVCGDISEVETAIRSVLSEFAGSAVAPEHLGDPVVMIDRPARSIATAALDHDLVIVASHGRTGLSRLLLGSVTEASMRIVPAPLLIVADDSALLPMERILVTTDLSSNSEAAFPQVRKLAQVTGAAIQVLCAHSTENPGVVTVEGVEQRVQAFVQPHFEGLANPIEVKALITSRDARDAVQTFIRDHRFNLVVMATVGTGSSEKPALGHLPAHLVRSIRGGLLLVNPDHQRELRRAALTA